MRLAVTKTTAKLSRHPRACEPGQRHHRFDRVTKAGLKRPLRSLCERCGLVRIVVPSPPEENGVWYDVEREEPPSGV